MKLLAIEPGGENFKLPTTEELETQPKKAAAIPLSPKEQQSSTCSTLKQLHSAK